MNLRRSVGMVLAMILAITLEVQSEEGVANIRVLPQKITLKPGQLQRFIAHGYDEEDHEVPFRPDWEALGGTIDEGGWYRAGNSGGNFWIMATDPATGAQGSASVTIVAEEGSGSGEEGNSKAVTTLALEPANVRLPPGGSCFFIVKAYSANGQQLPVNFRLIWRASGGSITTDGLYRAGGMPGNYYAEVATPEGMKARSTVLIEGVLGKISRLEIFPNEVKLRPKDNHRFFATAYDIGGNPLRSVPITWETTGGQIDPTSGIYTASDEPGVYLIKASAGEVFSSAKIVVERVAILKAIIDPGAVTLTPGGEQQFTIHAFDIFEKPTTTFPLWGATGGTIKPDGTYQAGKMPGTYQVTALLGEISVKAIVTIKAATPINVARLEIRPGQVTLAPGQSCLLEVACLDAQGQPVEVPLFQWESTGGTIKADGTYQAGEQAGEFMVQVSVPGGPSATTKVIISSSAPPSTPAKAIRWFTVTPMTAQVPAEGKLTFSAHGYSEEGNRIPGTVRWSATGGQIDERGEYTAGSQPGEFTISAQAENAMTATAKVVIGGDRVILPALAGQLQITPDQAALPCGGQQQFRAQGYDQNRVEVAGQWQWLASGGTITAEGVYQSGNQPGDYIISALELQSGLKTTVPVRLTPKEGQRGIVISKWQMGGEDPQMGKASIVGRVLHDRAHYLKLAVQLKNGQLKILNTIEIKHRQLFEFTATYVRQSTTAVVLILTDAQGTILAREERGM